MMGNMCMVMFGYDMIHITAYLPNKSRSEFCEEIPATGKVIMVFDIANPKFRDLPIEIRIIRDPLTPVTTETNLEPLTEVYFPATFYKKGTFSFEHDFKDNGHYIGLVTLTRENGEKETQQFKFSVGEVLWLYVPLTPWARCSSAWSCSPIGVTVIPRKRKRALRMREAA